MINYGSIYLIVKDFNKTVEFYKSLFEKEVAAQNRDRFAIFHVDGLCLSILNAYYDMQNPDKVITRGKYDSEYDNYVEIAEAGNTGKIVINLNTDDLQKEYNRLRQLKIGNHISEIKYINAKNPYYYFCLKDPDDNTIEITGPYEENENSFCK